jgi:hypothetical protein
VFAKNDAPGLSHYLGAGDLNSDGRLDITLAAKGGPSVKSGKGEWFAWWEAGEDPTKPFKKHRLPGKHPGATNILPADVNGDGKLDIIASRGHGTGLIWYENPRLPTSMTLPISNSMIMNEIQRNFGTCKMLLNFPATI